MEPASIIEQASRRITGSRDEPPRAGGVGEKELILRGVGPHATRGKWEDTPEASKFVDGLPIGSKFSDHFKEF